VIAMNLQAVAIVYRKELREWLRDRRTLISTVVVPLLLFPVIILGFTYLATSLIGKAKDEIPSVMIIGGEDSPQAVAALQKIDTLKIVPYSADWKNQISEKVIRVAVEIPPGFQASLEKNEEKTVTIYFYEGEIKSSFGAEHIEKSLKDYRDQVVKERLASRNIATSVLVPFEIKQQNVAPPEKVSGATIGGFIGYLVILLCMTGAMYPAIDLTAGEKERGTMETILSSPVSRMNLVLGKFLLVLSAALATAALSVISMGISFTAMKHLNTSVQSGRGEAAALILHLGPKSVVLIFLMALPLAVFFAAALMTIALFAKTYKEAQSYLTPMTFIVIIPAVASLLPGVELTPKLALVPILSTSLVCKEIIAGTYHWSSIALIFLSTCVYAAIALFLAVKMFQREDVLFRS
jgi:sodium transport system permease protein